MANNRLLLKKIQQQQNESDLFILVSGVNVHIVTTILCIVCVFYTTVGGMR